jgi:uncharacterized membrane protein YfcA
MEWNELINQTILILVLVGAFGGFLSGLLGVGGGIIFIPIITYFLEGYGLEGDEMVRYILANSFATIFFAGLISTYKQYRLQQFHPKPIAATASLAMVSSAAVTYMITLVDWYSQAAFSSIFIGLLIFTIIRFTVRKPKDTVPVNETKMKKYVVTGFLTGIVTSLSGLGGGVIMIPLFNQYVRIDMRSASAISIGVIPLILIPVLITYLLSSPEQIVSEEQLGYVIPGLFFPMVAGLLFAAPMGVATAQKVSDKLLKGIFVTLVIIVIINTTIKMIS